MDWSHRFNDTYYYRTKSSISDGNLTYGSWTSAIGRVEQYHRVIKTMGGNEAVTSHRIATSVSLASETQVDITGSEPSNANNALRILSRDIASTLDNGYTLYVYMLGK